LKAAEKGHTEVIQSLLAKGADPYATDNGGKTALKIAEEQGHQDAIKLLKDPGAPR
jgi:ankyrin repeat protein